MSEGKDVIENTTVEPRLIITAEDILTDYNHRLEDMRAVTVKKDLATSIWTSFEESKQIGEVLAVGSTGLDSKLQFNSITIGDEQSLRSFISSLTMQKQKSSIVGLYAVDLKKFKKLNES